MQIKINGTTMDLPRKRDVSIHELIIMLSIERQKSVITVKVNGDEIPQSEWLSKGAGPDDSIEITHT